MEPGWLLRLEERLGLLNPVQLLVFRSFGTPDALHLRGRVIEKKGVEGTTEKTSTWQNVLNTLHRLESTEIPGAQVRAHFQGRSWDTTSDEEGYFLTRSTEFFRQLSIIFGNGARDRVTFPGVPALYRALTRGPDGEGHNPVFYVSMSGWNLYDLLEEFLDINDIPPGPLFLNDLRCWRPLPR